MSKSENRHYLDEYLAIKHLRVKEHQHPDFVDKETTDSQFLSETRISTGVRKSTQDLG